MGIAAACVPAAAMAGVIDRASTPSQQGKQTWSAWGGEIGVRWNHDLLGNLGLAVDAARDQRLAKTDRRGHEWFGLRESGGLDFLVSYGALDRFAGGSLQMRGGYVLRLPDGSSLDLRNLTMRVRANDPGILDVYGSDGRSWFYIDRVMFELVDEPKPSAENDLSGFTWRSFSVLELKICGAMLYVYSMALVYWSMSLSPLSRYSLSEARSFEPMLDTMLDTISTTCAELSSSLLASPEASVPSLAAPNIMDVMSKPVLWICSGYSDSVSSSTDLM